MRYKDKSTLISQNKYEVFIDDKNMNHCEIPSIEKRKELRNKRKKKINYERFRCCFGF